MSRTKLALDVVQDLRSLADSIEVLANAIVDGAPEQSDAPKQSVADNAPQGALFTFTLPLGEVGYRE